MRTVPYLTFILSSTLCTWVRRCEDPEVWSCGLQRSISTNRVSSVQVPGFKHICWLLLSFDTIHAYDWTRSGHAHRMIGHYAGLWWEHQSSMWLMSLLSQYQAQIWTWEFRGSKDNDTNETDTHLRTHRRVFLYTESKEWTSWYNFYQ